MTPSDVKPTRHAARRLTLVFALALAVLMGLLAGQALAASVTYNLFATDGWVQMADGANVYTYGFIGGRADKTIAYQNSVVAPPGAGGGYVPGGLVTSMQKWPAPAGGGLTSIETTLAGNAQYPAPLIYCAVGDTVTINLKNLGTTWDPRTAPIDPTTGKEFGNGPDQTPQPTEPPTNDPHSIHLHGLDVDAANDGVPETSVAAVPANLTTVPNDPQGLLPASPRYPGAGNVVVYMFSPTKEGTYMYHCHQEADIHVQMGMYGALIVYNKSDPRVKTGPGASTGPGVEYGWKYNKDVVMLLSEFDTRQHDSEATVGPYAANPQGFNPVDYKPQYWFINGLSWPNTIHTDLAGLGGTGANAFNWNDWITAHPGYDPLITGSVSKKDKVLIRVINMGYEAQPMHMHGFHGKIIASDERPWTWANPPQNSEFAWGRGEEKQTLLIGSGETYDWMINFGLTPKLNATGGSALAPKYPTKTQTRYESNGTTPTANTLTSNPAIPVPGFPQPFTYIAGPAVTGAWGPIPVSALGLTNAQVFPFHNHDDYKATNNGSYPGGQFTAIIPQP